MDQQSESESQTNEDSSDNNLTPTANLESSLKPAGKLTTNSSVLSNGTQNGIDRGSPMRDTSAKQRSFNSSPKKNNLKKARQR